MSDCKTQLEKIKKKLVKLETIAKFKKQQKKERKKAKKKKKVVVKKSNEELINIANKFKERFDKMNAEDIIRKSKDLSKDVDTKTELQALKKKLDDLIKKPEKLISDISKSKLSDTEKVDLIKPIETAIDKVVKPANDIQIPVSDVAEILKTTKKQISSEEIKTQLNKATKAAISKFISVNNINPVNIQPTDMKNKEYMVVYLSKILNSKAGQKLAELKSATDINSWLKEATLKSLPQKTLQKIIEKGSGHVLRYIEEKNKEQQQAEQIEEKKEEEIAKERIETEIAEAPAISSMFPEQQGVGLYDKLVNKVVSLHNSIRNKPNHPASHSLKDGEKHSVFYDSKTKTLAGARFSGPGSKTLDNLRELIKKSGGRSEALNDKNFVDDTDKVALAHDLRYYLFSKDKNKIRDADNKFLNKLTENIKTDKSSLFNAGPAYLGVKAKTLMENVGILKADKYANTDIAREDPDDVNFARDMLSRLEQNGYGLDEDEKRIKEQIKRLEDGYLIALIGDYSVQPSEFRYRIDLLKEKLEVIAWDRERKQRFPYEGETLHELKISPRPSEEKQEKQDGRGKGDDDDVNPYEETKEEKKEDGDEEKQQGNGNLYGSEIDNLCKNIPHYQGTFARDKIRDVKKEDEFSFVYNTDTSNKSGQHWIAVYCKLNGKKPSIEHYDPLGNDIADDVKNELKTILGESKAKLKISRVVNQTNSDLCGELCALFLKQRNNGVNFCQATNCDEQKAAVLKNEKKLKKFKMI